MYDLVAHEGRIVAARIHSCPTVDVARALGRDVLATFPAPPAQMVATVDFRRAKLFTPEVTEVLLGVLKADNPRIERSAHLVGPESPTFALQVERLVREAANPRRQVFREPTAALAYLADVLTPAQSQWLRAWYVL